MYFYDEAAAERAVEFFARFLKHTKGPLAGKPFVLDPWQADRIIRPLFGWKRESDGLRRYRSAYVEVGRKNGKTSLASGVALYMLFADGEQGAEVISASGSRDQAAISFDIAKAMVLASPGLRRRAEIYRRSIIVPDTGSSYKVISADAARAHGANCSGVILDEIHTLPNRDLYDTLHTSMGARAQPIEFLITTAGVYDPESICWELHSYAKNVESGVVQDDSFLPVLYTADPRDDIQSPETWKRSNPGLGISVREEWLAQEAKRAASEPAYENTFRRLHLSQWTQQSTRWLQLEHWDACKRPSIDLTGRECYAGLDLASTSDTTSVVLAFPVDELVYLLPFFWIPESKTRNNKDGVNYALWQRQGYVTVTDGDVLDYVKLEADIVALSKLYKVREFRFDPFNATQITQRLTYEHGLPMVSHRQNILHMNAPAKEFERRMIAHTLAHDGHPVLRWQVGNVEVETDRSGNLMPTKRHKTARIDGVVAGIMSLAGVTVHHEPTANDRYRNEGLLIL